MAFYNKKSPKSRRSHKQYYKEKDNEAETVEESNKCQTQWITLDNTNIEWNESNIFIIDLLTSCVEKFNNEKEMIEHIQCVISRQTMLSLKDIDGLQKAIFDFALHRARDYARFYGILTKYEGIDKWDLSGYETEDKLLDHFRGINRNTLPIVNTTSKHNIKKNTFKSTNVDDYNKQCNDEQFFKEFLQNYPFFLRNEIMSKMHKSVKNDVIQRFPWIQSCEEDTFSEEKQMATKQELTRLHSILQSYFGFDYDKTEEQSDNSNQKQSQRPFKNNKTMKRKKQWQKILICKFIPEWVDLQYMNKSYVYSFIGMIETIYPECVNIYENVIPNMTITIGNYSFMSKTIPNYNVFLVEENKINNKLQSFILSKTDILSKYNFNNNKITLPPSKLHSMNEIVFKKIQNTLRSVKRRHTIIESMIEISIESIVGGKQKNRVKFQSNFDITQMKSICGVDIGKFVIETVGCVDGNRNLCIVFLWRIQIGSIAIGVELDGTNDIARKIHLSSYGTQSLVDIGYGLFAFTICKNKINCNKLSQGIITELNDCVYQKNQQIAALTNELATVKTELTNNIESKNILNEKLNQLQIKNKELQCKIEELQKHQPMYSLSNISNTSILSNPISMSSMCSFPSSIAYNVGIYSPPPSTIMYQTHMLPQNSFFSAPAFPVLPYSLQQMHTFNNHYVQVEKLTNVNNVQTQNDTLSVAGANN
eukprot:303402_1